MVRMRSDRSKDAAGAEEHEISKDFMWSRWALTMSILYIMLAFSVLITILGRGVVYIILGVVFDIGPSMEYWDFESLVWNVFSLVITSAQLVVLILLMVFTIKCRAESPSLQKLATPAAICIGVAIFSELSTTLFFLVRSGFAGSIYISSDIFGWLTLFILRIGWSFPIILAVIGAMLIQIALFKGSLKAIPICFGITLAAFLTIAIGVDAIFDLIMVFRWYDKIEVFYNTMAISKFIDIVVSMLLMIGFFVVSVIALAWRSMYIPEETEPEKIGKKRSGKKRSGRRGHRGYAS